MADPVPSLDELVEVAKKAARLERKSDLCALCTRFGNRVNCFCENEARAILTAVLPRVVGAAVEASKVFADVADDYDDTEDDDLQVLVDTDFLAPRLRLRSFRRARTVSDQLRALGGG